MMYNATTIRPGQVWRDPSSGGDVTVLEVGEAGASLLFAASGERRAAAWSYFDYLILVRQPALPEPLAEAIGQAHRAVLNADTRVVRYTAEIERACIRAREAVEAGQHHDDFVSTRAMQYAEALHQRRAAHDHLAQLEAIAASLTNQEQP